MRAFSLIICYYRNATQKENLTANIKFSSSSWTHENETKIPIDTPKRDDEHPRPSSRALTNVLSQLVTQSVLLIFL